MDKTVDDFLKHRDYRVEYQRSLVDIYIKTLVCVRVNYPSLNKENSTTIKINEIIRNEIINFLDDNIIFENTFISLEGPISLLVVDENPFRVKEICVDIEENHPVGRLVDIDVYDKNYKGISRIDLGMEKRKCFLCDNLAFVCSRAGKHSWKEIFNFIENTLNNYLYMLD